MPDAYDSLPYASYCYPFTHPDWLHVLARLFGHKPAPIDGCRVLELGCASAGNLLPMAELLPASRFVGIDRSQVQIARGRELLADLEFDNVELRCADLLDLNLKLGGDGAALGEFDYVICHGVYSWVPRPVQDRILALIAEVLAPEGVAIVSYNVYPGWHMRDIVRQLMSFHVGALEHPAEQIEQARAVVGFMARAADSLRAADDPYAALLRRELELLERTPDSYLFHEHLERDNRPLYFHEFIARLEGLPLHYLCDGELHTMAGRDLPTEVLEPIERISTGQVMLEQYLDFIRNRQFRTSVLTRPRDRTSRRIEPAWVYGLRFGAQAEVTSDGADKDSLLPEVELTLRTRDGATVASRDPMTKAALIELSARWPQTLTFDGLVTAAQARLAGIGMVAVDSPQLRAGLATDLVECLLRQAIVVRSWSPPIAPASAERPRLSAFARRIAAEEGWLPGCYHTRHTIDRALRSLVPLLDGTRDRSAVIAALLERVESGELEAKQDGEAVSDPVARKQAVGAFVDDAVAKLGALPALLGA